MKRDIIDKLLKWKNSNRRKPLILTGVRQCGKTYALKEFGDNYFDDVCYINFEESSQLAAVFEYDFDVNRIIKEIELYA
ncbi:MAG: AAA family ATPase, partial [Pseudobutyrivibrio sp.]|nr:AAA family ATPase [Pseudobutyrivibrio sp.]